MIREQLSAALFNNTQAELIRELFCDEQKKCSALCLPKHSTYPPALLKHYESFV